VSRRVQDDGDSRHGAPHGGPSPGPARALHSLPGATGAAGGRSRKRKQQEPRQQEPRPEARRASRGHSPPGVRGAPPQPSGELRPEPLAQQQAERSPRLQRAGAAAPAELWDDKASSHSGLAERPGSGGPRRSITAYFPPLNAVLAAGPAKAPVAGPTAPEPLPAAALDGLPALLQQQFSRGPQRLGAEGGGLEAAAGGPAAGAALQVWWQ
jgi:hypothetical protein